MAKVYKRTDRDCWVADYRDFRGKRHRLSARTRKEAETLLADKLNEARKPGPSVDASTSLYDYAMQWLEDVRSEMDPRTYESYRGNLVRHVLPALGRLTLASLTTGIVRRFLREKQHEGYAPNTVRLMRASLSVVLSDAVTDDVLTSNPAIFRGGRKRGAGRMTKSDRESGIRPMSSDQRERFLVEAYRSEHGVLFETLVKTGLRPSEGFALRVDDLDLRRGTLRVERSLGIQSRVLKDTKTHEARDVDLSPELAALLEDYVAALRRDSLRNGWGEPEWLFPSTTMTPLDHNNVAKVFKRVLKRAGLPGFRLYDLRHTYASLMLAAGAPISFVSHQLGHRTPDTTLRFYARWLPSTGKSFAALADQSASEHRTLDEVGTKVGTKTGTEDELSPQMVDTVGEPRRNRTFNLRIKSPLLCQLS